jgi:PadR family transcriptional regulator PadR
MPKPSDLLQGTLDLLIPKTLARDPLHGWGVAKRIQELSDDVVFVQQGSLYPSLPRLEQQGWITAEWREHGLRPECEGLLPDARGQTAA